jgi:hypothetical protein
VVVVLIFAEKGGNAVRCCVGVGGLDVVFIGLLDGMGKEAS